MTDDIGDRMKRYEMAEAGRSLIPLLPSLARIDGRSFHNFTRDCKRPFDAALHGLMCETALYLAVESGATVGYTQSDEITLCWYSDEYKSQTFFDGRIQKLTSVLASMAAAYFARHLEEYLPEHMAMRLPHFDCRVWNVPNLDEAANTFVWRELDATKNSVSMAARAKFSHKALMNKGRSEMQEMLFAEGVNWNDYPDCFKRGSFVRRKVSRRKFKAGEIAMLPAKHEARLNPDLEVERTDWHVEQLPQLLKTTNRVDVLFRGADPVLVSNGVPAQTGGD